MNKVKGGRGKQHNDRWQKKPLRCPECLALMKWVRDKWVCPKGCS